MSDLDIIKTIEKQVCAKLNTCELSEIMNASSRGCYTVNEQQQVTGLNLQNYKLSNISCIKALKNLRKVNLALNHIVKLSPLKKLAQLEELNLQKNQIVEIDALERLETLSHLNLQANKINTVEALYRLNALRDLNLSSNEITDFEPLGELSQLTHLNLSDNQISSLLPLKTISELIELDLRFNKINNLAGLSHHKKLEKLFLSTNQITDIDLLNNLPSLTQLYLSSNNIRDISAIKSLNSLVLLDLRSNKIEDIEPLESLTTLTHLHLEENEISDISSLSKLDKLIQLNLRHNQINNIEALKGLKNLTHLYLSDNEIKALPRWILDFNLPIKWNTGGQGISVISNPIITPPPDVIRQGNTGIKNFFNATQKRALNKVKILLVGDKGVGKTSLSKVLRNVPFDETQEQTQGINIDLWQQDGISANLWDFGGESNLLATHKFFFSNRSLYILVLDNRELRNEERWLKRIESFGGNSSVLIVLNKFDQENTYDVERKHLLRRYKGLRGVFPVSCAQGVGLDSFKQGLMSALQHVPTFNTDLSENCFHIKATLEKLQQEMYYIPYQSYIAICEKQKLSDTQMQEDLLQLLHDLGSTIYFQDPDTEGKYILDPRWITQALYRITTAHQIADTNGVMLLKDLNEILNPEHNESYLDEKQRYLIDLMKKFNLCYQIDEDKILIPQLLSKTTVETEFDDSNALHFQIQYNYLDESVMPRLIVAMHQQIDINKSSCHCIFLHNPELDCTALVEMDYDNDAVYIKIDGEHKRDYFTIIRNTLYDIHW